MKPTGPKRGHSATKEGKRRGRSPPSEGLSLRHIKLILLAGLFFGAVSALILTWDQIFPVPKEDLVEVVWTHECQCADGWMDALRSKGFVVRDFELDTLAPTRQQWHVPAVAKGCHPALYMGYIVDGHVPPDTLRRLGREHPAAVGLIQVGRQERPGNESAGAAQLRFELLDPDGGRHSWP